MGVRTLRAMGLAGVIAAAGVCGAIVPAGYAQNSKLRSVEEINKGLRRELEQALSPRAELERRVDEVIGKHALGQFWGSVGVVFNGVEVTRGYGLADETLRPIDGDSILDIASISKQFTAAAILKLQEQGKLSIDDPVAKFFPQAGAGGGRAQKVTLRHLMQHTSGMNGESSIMPLDYADREKAVAKAMRSMRDREPGEAFEYANAGYVVLGAVIEVASGQEFGAYVRENIFNPAGLKSTGFLDGVGLDLKHGTVRVVNGMGAGRMQRRGLLQDGWGWGFKGCGGVLSTAKDMLKWHSALTGETVLTADSKNELFTPAKDGYALGWVVDVTPSGKKRQSHSGGTRGYTAWFARYPEEKAAIIVMTSSAYSAPEIGEKIQRALWAETPDVQSTIDTREFKANEKPLLSTEDGLDVGVRMDGKLVVIDVLRKGAKKPLATLALGPAVARRAAEQIREYAKRKDEPVRVGGFVGFKPYTLEGGVAHLPKDVAVRVRPRYEGYDDRTRESIVDDRVMLVAMDEGNGFWPVIVKMDHTTARRVAEEIDELLK